MLPPVDPARYAAYLGVASVMVATPGPANLFAIATGASRGKRAVLAAVIGMNFGSLVWLAAAGLGLGALARTFPFAFRLMAYGGAAYLAWLGLKALLAAFQGEGALGHAPTLGRHSAFREGFMVQLSNPKALLFITAILPPFLDTSRPMWGQIAVFAATTVFMDLVAKTAYGFGGAALAVRMSQPKFRRGFQVFTGLLLMSAALLILLRE